MNHDNQLPPHLQAFIESLSLEVASAKWNKQSMERLKATSAVARRDLHPEFLDAVLWFIAAAAVTGRLPNEQEAAELGMAPEALEQIRTGWDMVRSAHDGTPYPGPAEVIH